MRTNEVLHARYSLADFGHDDVRGREATRRRFYAGHPLKAADGRLLGVFCLNDCRPRTLSDEDVQLFRDLAVLAQEELRLLETGERQGERPQPPESDFLRERALVDRFIETVPDSIYFKDREGHFLRISNAVAGLKVNR